MSFDLYFLSKRADQSWEDALDALEDDAEADAPLSASDLELWRRLEGGLRAVLPELEVFEGERERELTDERTGIQVSLFPGELSLSVPYWYSGPEADQLVDLLRRVASIIERESGLIAYDPQADAPFLGDGDASATASFDLVHESFTDRAIVTGLAGELSGADKPPSLWRRLFGGRSR